MSAILQLRNIREKALLDPDQVVRLTNSLLATGKVASAGDEQWDIYEQACLAALETGDDSLALQCMTRLSDKFPESGRVHAIKGMYLEATEQVEEAFKFYTRVLNVEPTNVPVLKRRIALNKSLGRIGAATTLLVEYLDTFYSDADAWWELGELYTNCNLHEKAAFCFAEVVLLKPYDHLAHARYGDSLYSLAGSSPEAIHLALKEYLRSIELCDDYVRGFCGLKACCKAILAESSTSTPRTNNKSGKKELIKAGEGAGDVSAIIVTEKVQALDLMATRVLSGLQISKRPETQDEGVGHLIETLLDTPVNAR